MRLIDKKELMELLDDMFSRYDGTPSVMEGFKYGLDAVISEVSVMPTIEAEPIKIGHWIEKGIGIAECDVCNQQNLYRQDGVGVLTKYCPSCGARMEW